VRASWTSQKAAPSGVKINCALRSRVMAVLAFLRETDHA
jgi:hypothetical protein